MHVAVDPNRLVNIGVMPLGFELEVGHQVVTAIDFLDAVHDISAEELVCLPGMFNLLSFEFRTVCCQLINLFVQLVRISI